MGRDSPGTVDLLVPVRVTGSVPGVRRGVVECVKVAVPAPQAETVPGRTGYVWTQRRYERNGVNRIDQTHHVDTDGATYRSEDMIGPGVDPVAATSRAGGIVVPRSVSGDTPKAVWMARHPVDRWTVVDGPPPPEVEGHVRALVERGLRLVGRRVHVRADRPHVVVEGEPGSAVLRVVATTPGDPPRDDVAPWRRRPLSEIASLREGDDLLPGIDYAPPGEIAVLRCPRTDPVDALTRIVRQVSDEGHLGRWVRDPRAVALVASLADLADPTDHPDGYAIAAGTVLASSEDPEARLLSGLLYRAVRLVPEPLRVPEPFVPDGATLPGVTA